ncbi:MAG: glycosyltransferase [Betaproteobacteria bacterium]|nr:glycosyltransferase [Betaproteobacteria bacterium]
MELKPAKWTLDEDLILPWVWATVLVAVIIVAAIPVDSRAQMWVAGWVLLIMSFMRRRQRLPGSYRVLFLCLGAYLTARYFFWRTFSTLGYHDIASYIGTWLLYLAEVFGIALFFLGIFVNIRPAKRSFAPLPDDPRQLPSVDVLVPSYNEAPEMLEVTLSAAVQIRYPKEKLRVYLLDDGGTVQKRNGPSAEEAAAAVLRHQTLRAMCERIGAHYLTRENNEHAKAGNINEALKNVHGDLVLISPDPIEKNLQVFDRMPAENEMFYSVIQHGLDFWNGAFFCGSAGILRRKHLDEIGGMSGASITEDAETSLVLHRHGYNSAYINHPMISGLQPATYTDFVVQRLRWTQGMVQIFVLNNPMSVKGLKFWQRLCYLSSSFFWFFGYARVIFLVAPAAYLLFSLRVYDANLREVLVYAVPHLIGGLLVNDYLFGRVRWAFVSELYEIMLSLFSLPIIIRVLMNPHEPKFIVTPKGEQVSQDFISKLATPFYVIYAVTLVACAMGVYRFFEYPFERDTIYVTMAWELLNLVVLNAALGALYERRQRRVTPRMPANIDAQLQFDGQPLIQCNINDLSGNGALLSVSESAFAPVKGVPRAELVVLNPALRKISRLHVIIRSSRATGNGRMAVGLEFSAESQSEKLEKVALVHGDSERWVRFMRTRNTRQGIVRSFLLMLTLGIKFGGVHFRAVFQDLFGGMAKPVGSVARPAYQVLKRGVIKGRAWLLGVPAP